MRCACATEIRRMLTRLLRTPWHPAPNFGRANSGTHLPARHDPRPIPEDTRNGYSRRHHLTSIRPRVSNGIVAKDRRFEPLMFVGSHRQLRVVVATENVKS